MAVSLKRFLHFSIRRDTPNGYIVISFLILQFSRAPHIKYSCSKPNEKCVEAALDPNSNWMTMLHYVPFLKNSPAAPFLTGYYPDGVGMSAVDTGTFHWK